MGSVKDTVTVIEKLIPVFKDFLFALSGGSLQGSSGGGSLVGSLMPEE